MQSFMNDTTQYFLTVIYVLALLFHIALLYKSVSLGKKKKKKRSYSQYSIQVMDYLNRVEGLTRRTCQCRLDASVG